MPYDTVLRGGTIYDGSGGSAFQGDVAIIGDRIAAVDKPGTLTGTTTLDVDGLAVSPGFINMLSWSVESLIEDGLSQSEIRQGVTLEVMGEGESMGPLSEQMKANWSGGILGNPHIQYDIEWSTLGEYLEYLERRGVSPNIASYVGTGTIRIHEMGYENRQPTERELNNMKALVAQAMAEGAVGLSAALIYPPASYATTDELKELAAVAAQFDGVYSSHLRSEGIGFHEALDEFLTIVRDTDIRGEIYHLKAQGRTNWHKMDGAVRMIEAARTEGLRVTADLYPYPYSGTGLSACIPPWAHEGGLNALVARLRDPDARARIRQEMTTNSNQWGNVYYETGAEGILLPAFRAEHLKPYGGMFLLDISRERGTTPEDTLMDLLIEENGSIFALYFSISEENLRKLIPLPWLSFCSDAESMAPEGVFLLSNPHPRAYGAFARVLGKYVRDEKLITLQEAVRKLTSLPASVLKLPLRGRLAAGYYADIAVFDPHQVRDHAVPEQPHQYSAGMVHVMVNGTSVLKDGQHTGAKPGRFVRGPGWKPA